MRVTNGATNGILSGVHSYRLILYFPQTRKDMFKQQRLYCLICGSGDIEDEYHFVCICKPYETIRKQYLKKTYYVRPSVAKFIDLLQPINTSVLIRLCKFILEAFVIRSNIVNNVL